MTLRSYFESEVQQRRALDSFFDAWGGFWLVGKQTLDLYQASRCAFDPSSDPTSAIREFTVIYKELSSANWQVFRHNKKEAKGWPAEKIFETISREFSPYSWGSANLLDFAQSGTGAALEDSLNKMAEIKPNKGFPIMAVSKFLHFYNPSLFPIYDTAKIWNKVCNGKFKADYQEFSRHGNVPKQVWYEDTVGFIPHYMRWAGSLLSTRHANFMSVFVEWLSSQPNANLSSRNFDPETLYATAFEYVVIGASKVDG